MLKAVFAVFRKFCLWNRLDKSVFICCQKKYLDLPSFWKPKRDLFSHPSFCLLFSSRDKSGVLFPPRLSFLRFRKILEACLEPTKNPLRSQLVLDPKNKQKTTISVRKLAVDGRHRK